MIKSITATNFRGESIKMVLTEPWDSGFIVESIDGLGAPKADINITDISGADGGLFNSARVPSRNITIKLRFLEKPDIETTRQNSYKYFPLKKQLTLTIEEDHRTASIDGYVESNEPDIFSEEEGCQISLLCPNPYFKSEDNITVFAGLEGLFEFPFSNESLSEKLLIMGEYRTDAFRDIIYNGDVDTGIQVLIHCYGPATNISIINGTSREVLTINTSKIETITGAGLGVGDDIVVSTIRGNRFIMLYRNGKYYNILNSVDKNSAWPQLYSGVNTFNYTAESGTNDLYFKIINNVLYEGM